MGEIDTELGFACNRINDGYKIGFPSVSKHRRQSLIAVLLESMKNICLNGNSIR